MKLRLECYDHERDAAVAAIKSAFRTKNVSKGYPNLRQTSVSGTPCESRYYIEADGVTDTSIADLMAADMFRFLRAVTDACGIDPEPEIAKMRSFYESAQSLSDAQKFELLSEWRAALLGRCLKGGVPHAAGNR